MYQGQNEEKKSMRQDKEQNQADKMTKWYSFSFNHAIRGDFL
jgi:hypothetical protein